MAKRLDASVRQWALIGAEQRLVQLAAEAAAIHRAFPELRQRGRKAGAPPAAAAGGRRRKRRLSAEARRRISEAQKARWARHRSKKAKA